ncbi:MAG: hypothetical protein ACI81T_003477 [Bacteroidia bacterium]|jgi:hypothetical protein
MTELLKEIFSSGFSLVEENENFSYFNSEDKEHYFILAVDFEEFKKIKQEEAFSDISGFEQLKEYYETASTTQSNTILKNSSLIITIKLPEKKAEKEIQKQILLVEEDEYNFKKYVILWTDDAISGMSDASQVHSIVSNSDWFQQYKSSEGSEYEKYWVAVQLYIKLPFMVYTSPLSTLISLETRLGEELQDDIELVDVIHQNADTWNEEGFLDSEEKLDEILQKLNLTDNNDSD